MNKLLLESEITIEEMTVIHKYMEKFDLDFVEKDDELFMENKNNNLKPILNEIKNIMYNSVKLTIKVLKTLNHNDPRILELENDYSILKSAYKKILDITEVSLVA